MEQYAPAFLPLYLDHPGSAPPAEEVIDAMLPWLRKGHANPHAEHRHGQRAATAVEQARARVAALIGAEPEEIVFTSGATEANNLALRGLWAEDAGHGVLAISPIEHKSLLETARDLSKFGLTIRSLATDSRGRIDSDAVHAALGAPDVTQMRLVTLAHANNELGTVQSVAELASVTHHLGGYVHVDAAQSAGKLRVDVGKMGVDLASVSSHKMYGPAGIGALYVAADMRAAMRPLMTGGGQEGGLRPGTVPVFLAVGFGEAATLAARRLEVDEQQLQAVATAFVQELRRHDVDHDILSPPQGGLPGLVSLFLPNMDAADLLDRLAWGVSASTGSACNAGEVRASHVLRAIGLSEAHARQVVRLGFGRDNTEEEARWVAIQLSETLKRMRAQA